jgi:flagellar biosynthesis/type III secretory pathway M-ring protein FliF/YscJ
VKLGMAQAREEGAAGGEPELTSALVPRKGADAQRMEKRLMQVSGESPEAVARVVRAWLAE